MKRKSLILSLALLIVAFLPVYVFADTDYECPGHIWSEWHKDYEPTCGDPGEESRYCTIDECGAYDYRDIPATGKHRFGNWIIEEKPTCTERGLKYRECSVCYEYEEVAIPATGKHSWTSWEIVRKATALKEGKKTRYCRVCDKTQSAGIAKLKAKVSLNKKTLSLKKGKKYTLKIKSKTYGDKVSRWSSSNKKVATVTSGGKVTAKKKGKTTITLKMKSGAKVSCKVTVK